DRLRRALRGLSIGDGLGIVQELAVEPGIGAGAELDDLLLGDRPPEVAGLGVEQVALPGAVEARVHTLGLELLAEQAGELGERLVPVSAVDVPQSGEDLRGLPPDLLTGTDRRAQSLGFLGELLDLGALVDGGSRRGSRADGRGRQGL